MSGPGGPASLATTATPPSAARDPNDIARIKGNIRTILLGGGGEGDVENYLSQEGVTGEEIKNSPVAGPGDITTATPTAQAYNPSLMDRAADLFRAQRTGTRAPQLPNDAGMGLQALDALNTFNQGVDVAAHGMTGGLTDEAVGLGGGVAAVLPGSAKPGTFSQGYHRSANAENANVARFKQDYPIAGSVIEATGMVTSPLFRVGESWQKAAPTVLGRAIRGGVQGAGAGAVTGFGYNEGDIGDKLMAAGLGGAFGGGAGAAIAPIVEGGSGFATAVQARRAASQDARGHALDLLAKNVSRDRMAPETFLPMEGESLATLGGPNVQGLARGVTAAPGNARAVAGDYFSAANAGRYDALGQAAKTNVSGKGYLGTLDELNAAQKEASGPAYQTFYHVDPERFDTPFFQNLVSMPEGQDLLRKAYKIASLEKARGEIPDNPLQYLLDAEGNVSTRQALNPRAVDYMKQALDQEVETFTDPLTKRIKGPLGYQWDQLRRKFITEADKASTVDGVSLYQEARNAYSGPAELKEAMQAGTEAFGGGKLTSEKIAAFNKMPPAKQDAFRIGLSERIIEDAGKMGPNTDPLQYFLKGGDAGNRAQLIKTYLSDPDAYENFVRTLQSESRKVQAQKMILGGSPTSRIDAEKIDAALESQVAQARDVWRMVMGGVGEKIGGFASTVRRLKDKAANAGRGLNENVADELAPMLFNPNPEQNKRIMQDLYARALLGGARAPTTVGGSAAALAKALLSGPTRPGTAGAPIGALTAPWAQ